MGDVEEDMKRKIEISEIERTVICAALCAYERVPLASWINSQFIDAADPANDGPEVDILRAQVQS
jgi:hypothetical protein